MKKRHWLDIAEYTSLAGLGVGAVLSHLSSQLLYTSAPLSMVLVFNLLNRRRLDLLTEQNNNTAIQNLDHKLSKSVQILDKHLKDLPMPEDLAGVKKSLLSRNREVLEKLSQDIAAVQAEIKERLVPLEQQNLGSVREEMAQLREQYRQLGESVAFVTARLQDTSSTEKFDVLNQAIAQLKKDAAQIRTNLQALSEQTKPTLTSLQDQITHLNRQFQKLPPPFDSTALKQEVTELIRVVAELVPKRDWSNLVTELRTLQQQQESQLKTEETLRRKLQDLSQDLQSRPMKANLASLQNQLNYLNSQFQKLPPPFDPTSLKQEISELIQTLAERTAKGKWTTLEAKIKELQKQQEFQTQVETALKRELQDISRQLTAFVRGETVAPPGSLQAAMQARKGIEATETPLPQREFQLRLEAALQEELQEVERQLQLLPDRPELQAQVEATVSRELLEINRHLRSYPTEPQYELVFDFKNGNLAIAQDNPASSCKVLEEALATTQERLLLIWPWSSQCVLDEELLQRIETFLQQGKRLDLGWCHQVGREDRFLSVINQRWSIQLRQRELQETLQKLLQLKQSYPGQFWFQILGTAENFLVSDQRFAVLGTDESLTSQTAFPNLELKLRTTDASVIQQLIQRFDHPTLHSNDVLSHWNRAVTRYDLGDREGALEDLNQVLAVMVNDVVAYNYRGLVRYDLGDRQGAITDFNRALKLNPNYGIALCNRGFVLSELGDQLGAIADFSLAVQNQPDFAIAYFYRGVAGQKFGDLPGALTDYSEAIRLVPNSAPCYYYRGLTRQKMEDVRGAIADLLLAEALFNERNNQVNAQKARKYLNLLSQTIPPEELAAIEAAQADILIQLFESDTSDESESLDDSIDAITSIQSNHESADHESADGEAMLTEHGTEEPSPSEATSIPTAEPVMRIEAEPLGDDAITALLTDDSTDLGFGGISPAHSSDRTDTQDHPGELAESVPTDNSNTSEGISDFLSEDISESVPEATFEGISDFFAEENSEDLVGEISELLAEEIPEPVSDLTAEDIPEGLADFFSEGISESIAESTSESISKSTSTPISEDEPEDVPEVLAGLFSEDTAESSAQTRIEFGSEIPAETSWSDSYHSDADHELSSSEASEVREAATGEDSSEGESVIHLGPVNPLVDDLIDEPGDSSLAEGTSEEAPFTLDMLDGWNQPEEPSTNQSVRDEAGHGETEEIYSETDTQVNLPSPADLNSPTSGTETLSSFFSDVPLFSMMDKEEDEDNEPTLDLLANTPEEEPSPEALDADREIVQEESLFSDDASAESSTALQAEPENNIAHEDVTSTYSWFWDEEDKADDTPEQTIELLPEPAEEPTTSRSATVDIGQAPGVSPESPVPAAESSSESSPETSPEAEPQASSDAKPDVAQEQSGGTFDLSDIQLADLFGEAESPSEESPSEAHDPSELANEARDADLTDMLAAASSETEDDTAIALSSVEEGTSVPTMNNGNGLHNTTELMEMLWESPFDHESAPGEEESNLAPPEPTPTNHQVSVGATAMNHSHETNHTISADDLFAGTDTMESFFAEVEPPSEQDNQANSSDWETVTAPQREAEETPPPEPETLSDFSEHFGF